MKDEERAEQLLRSFYDRALRLDAERRASRAGGTGHGSPVRGLASDAGEPTRTKSPNAGFAWHPLRALLAVAASLAIMTAASLGGPRNTLSPDGIVIAAGELAAVAEERGFFIPFRALWPATDNEGGEL